jgi:hypothetical protein
MTLDNIIGGIICVCIAIALAGASVSMFLMVLDDYKKSNKRKDKK